MELTPFFKSIVEEDKCAVVICDTNHIIIYMNPAAIRRYQKHGGSELIGKSLMDCHNEDSRKKIEKVVEWFGKNEENNMIYTFYNEKENKDVYMVALRDSNKKLIGYYEKHEYRDRETADLYDFSQSLI